MQRFSRSVLATFNAGQLLVAFRSKPEVLTVGPCFAISLSSHQSSRTMSSKLAPADRIRNTEPNVWVEFIQLALENKPVNLGQGFPDFSPPNYVTKAVSEAVLSENVLLNQYTRSYGHPRLVNIISKFFSKLTGHNIDAHTEILVTIGAYEALFCAIMGNVNPGDEVIIIEPFFDSYEPMVHMAGGTPVYIPLRPTKSGQVMSSEDWVLDPDELKSKFNSKTKAIIVNTPHNPLGKVFKKEELQVIADLAKKWDTLVIMDEVYEWIVYKGKQHIRMATLPGMWDRTITIGSAGKTFSVTGWKLGWAYGPKRLMSNLQAMHQNCIYTCPTPIQEAVAVGFELEIGRLEKPECYFNELPELLQSKRDKMAKFLLEANMIPVIPEGGYFMLADYSKLAPKANFDDGSGKPKDHKFCRWLVKEKKVAAIPPTAFYGKEHKNLAENYIRFCFIKEDSTLEAAEKILKDFSKL